MLIPPACPVLGRVEPAMRLWLIGLVAITVAIYQQLVIRRVRPGVFRCAVCLPALAIHVLVPLLFDCHQELFIRGTLIFIFSLLGNFKLMALCINRGPLSHEWHFVQSTLILYQPIYPDLASKGKVAITFTSFMSSWLIKSLLLAPTVYFLGRDSDGSLINRLMKEVACILLLYFLLGAYMDLSALIVHRLNIPLLTPFDCPWMATSVSEFWGCRWNLTVSHLLRDLFYDTVIEGSLVKVDRPRRQKRPMEITPQRRALGLASTFFASAVMHEIIFWQLQTDGLVTWKWFSFFVLQPPIMMLERFYLSKLSETNPWIRRALTLTILFYLAHLLFFPPMYADSDSLIRLSLALGLSSSSG